MSQKWIALPYRKCQLCSKQRGYTYNIITHGIWWEDTEEGQITYIKYLYCIICYQIMNHLWPDKTKLIYNYFDKKYVETSFVDYRDTLHSIMKSPGYKPKFLSYYSKTVMYPKWFILYYFFIHNDITIDIFNYMSKLYYHDLLLNHI